jgi:predicted DNA-binding transcriptional regulator YafY
LTSTDQDQQNGQTDAQGRPALQAVAKIHQALAEHRTLRTRASRDSEDTRAIDPYHLTLHDGGLYLSATATCATPSASSPWSACAPWS